MKHLLKIVVVLLIIIILYAILKKNKIIEKYGGHGWAAQGWRGHNGWGHGRWRLGRRRWSYNRLHYQPTRNLCYDSLGNLTYCLTPNLIRPYFYY